MSSHDDPPRLPRRHLLGVGAAGLASLALPQGCSGQSSPPLGPGVDSGPPDDASGDGDGDPADASADCGGACAKDANTLVIPLASTPALNKAGGSATVTDGRFKDMFCLQSVVIVVQPKEGEFLAFSASCTHNCCTVSFTGNGFHCPCHQSTFDLTGKVTGGPAGAPLQKLPTCADGCSVYVQLK
jgi:Rieske Fe-S protein